MYQTKSRRGDDRIVSMSQSYVRPIIRGKLDKPVVAGTQLVAGAGCFPVSPVLQACFPSLPARSQVARLCRTDLRNIL